MKYIFPFLIGLLCFTASISAQDSTAISELFAQNEFSSNSDNDLLFICRASLDEHAKQDKWEAGILIDYNDKAHHVESHYNSTTDEMQILLRNQSRTLYPQKVKAIKVGEMIFVPCEYKGSETLTYGYFQVLSSNRIDLLVRFENMNKAFYTRKENAPAKSLKLSKSSIIKELDDKKTTKYLKEQQLDIKNEQDLVKLFNYHNSL